MNRTEVLERLANVRDVTVRDIQHQPTTRVQVTPEMVVLHPGHGARNIGMTEEGVKSMASYAGLPKTLIQKISPRTFSQVATELLERQRGYSVLMQEGRIVGFSDRVGHRAIPTERVLQTIERSIPVHSFQRVVVTDPSNVALEVVSTTEKAVARGDLVRGGALVNFSPVGTILPSVQSYVCRLSCTNGAVSMDFLEEYRFGGGGGGEGDDIWQWFRQAVRESCNKLGAIVERWQKMKEGRIAPGERAALLEGLIKQAKLPDEAADTIRAMALENPPRNHYDLMNLITYASTHLLTEPKEIHRAQKTAAVYDDPATHSKVCPVCHRSR